MKTRNMLLVLSLIAVFAAILPACGQSDYATASLKGTVTDPQGAVISGATVTATNSATGLSKTTKTGPDGSYQIPVLPPGTYSVAFESQGFNKTVVKGVQLSVGQSSSYDAHLKLGSVGETLEVSADNVPLIQTDQTQQANLIDQRQVENLPNLGRNFTYEVYTLPGVTNSDSPRSQNPGFTGYLTTGFSIGGSNGRNNLSTIDGGENEYGTGQYRITNLPVDAIQEYQVNRNGSNAEFGFTSGSAINIVTKSGTNQVHGDVYGFFRNQAMEATNFFNGLPRTATDPTKFAKASSQNVFAGGAIGGPIVHNKVFYYGSYEFTQLNTPNFDNATILTQPTVLGLSNPLLGNNNPKFGNCGSQFGPGSVGIDQLCYVNALKTSGNPFLVGFANGITPGLTPLNNPALNTILHRDTGVFNNGDALHNFIVRLDFQPNERDSITFRVGYAHNNFTSPAQGILNGSPDSYTLFVRDTSILTNWSRTISSNLVNQVVVQIVPQNSSNALPGPFQGVNFSLGNLGAPGPGGTSTFGSPALLPYKAHQQRFQFEDNITWIKGAHTFKFGASYRPANYHIENDLWFNPEFDFKDGFVPLIALAPSAVQAQLSFFNFQQQHMPGIPTDMYGAGCSAATLAIPATLRACIGPATTNLSAPQSFAFGVPVDVLAGFNNPVWTGWGHYFGSYAQDSWKLTSRLTMNAGVRFDFDGEPSPLSTSFYASPRLGFAWDPFGDHKTVLRASGGVFVAPVDVLIPSYGSLLDGTGRYINEVAAVLSPTNTTVAKLWGLGVALGELPFGRLTPADFAAVGINTTTPGASVGYSVAPNYKNPYTVQTSFSVDRELIKNMSLELGYNMYHGVHLQMPVETAYGEIPVGSPLCPTPACKDVTGGPLYAPLTGQIQHTTYSSIGSSIYHGLTASLTKRYSHGLQFQVNYTWSKTIDDVIDFASFQNWFRPSRLGLYRAVSVFDVPHTLVANAVYNTPFKTSSSNFFKQALADISIAPVVTVHSGLPFSIRTPSLPNGTAIDNNFAMPFGASRDQNRGPVFASTDLRLTKTFFIDRESGLKLDLMVEGANIFNRINFNKVADVFDINGFTPTVQTARGPLNLLTGPFTGLKGVVPTSQDQVTTPLSFAHADLARRIQLGMKLSF